MSVRRRYDALRASAFSIALLSQLQGEVSGPLTLTATPPATSLPDGRTSFPDVLRTAPPEHVGFASSSPQILLTTPPTVYVPRAAAVTRVRGAESRDRTGPIPNLLTTTLVPTGAAPFTPVDVTRLTVRAHPLPSVVPNLLTSTLAPTSGFVVAWAVRVNQLHLAWGDTLD